MHVSNCGFSVGRIVVKDVRGSSVGHDYKIRKFPDCLSELSLTSFVHGNIEVLDLSKASEDLSNVILGDILCQFLDDNLVVKGELALFQYINWLHLRICDEYSPWNFWEDWRFDSKSDCNSDSGGRDLGRGCEMVSYHGRVIEIESLNDDRVVHETDFEGYLRIHWDVWNGAKGAKSAIVLCPGPFGMASMK